MLCSSSAAFALAAEEIINRAVKHDGSVREQQEGMEYELTITIDKLSRHGETLKSKTETKTMRPARLISYSMDVDDAEEMLEAGHKPKPDRKKNITAKFTISDMRDRFKFKLLGKESVRKQRAYKIFFEPKPDQDYNSREEKVMNHISGHVWIATSDYSILRTEGSLTRYVDVAWFFVTLKKMDFLYESKRLKNGLTAPDKFVMQFHIDATLAQIYRRQTSIFANHRETDK
ncbi:MAG: hypothetical protein AAF984_03145 [Verrucomicrobiota bacterium]